MRLFVGGLSFTTTNDSLRAAFARFGTVTAATVMTDRETGKSRGFGFVEMATDEDADRALAGINGAALDGRMIRVDKAMPRGSGAPARRPGGGGPPRSSSGPPRQGQGGWSPPPPALGETRGRTSQGAGKRRNDDDRDRRPEKKRRGKPPGSRRADDKGRRGDESGGYRW